MCWHYKQRAFDWNWLRLSLSLSHTPRSWCELWANPHWYTKSAFLSNYERTAIESNDKIASNPMKNIGGGTNGRANSSSSINHSTNLLCVSLYFSLSLVSNVRHQQHGAHNSASKLTNLLAINIDYENIYIKHKYFEYILKFFTSKMLTASHLIVVWSGKKKWAWGIARVFCCCYSLLLLLPVAGVVISHLVIDRLIIINENGVSRQQQQQNDIYFYALCVADNNTTIQRTYIWMALAYK